MKVIIVKERERKEGRRTEQATQCFTHEVKGGMRHSLEINHNHSCCTVCTQTLIFPCPFFLFSYWRRMLLPFFVQRRQILECVCNIRYNRFVGFNNLLLLRDGNYFYSLQNQVHNVNMILVISCYFISRISSLILLSKN